MSNKTSDKNVAKIEDDVNELKSIMNLRTEFGFAYSQKNTLELQKSIRNVLAEREQKDKRIQELENKLQDINTYILINGIDEPLRTATQIQVENQHEYIIQQKINKLEEERDHWHGCFIVAMENSIAKEKVMDKIKEIKYLQSRTITSEAYNIAQGEIIVLQELLEGGENEKSN